MRAERQITLSAAELKVLVSLIDRASDEMSSHGCNDYSLTRDADLTAEEANTVREMMYSHLSEDEQYSRNDDDQADWLVLNCFNHKFKKALSSL